MDGFNGFGGFGNSDVFGGFGGFGVIFGLMFALVLGVFVFTLIKGVSRWNKNNHSPRLTVGAVVSAKREEVSHHSHADANGVGMHTSASTSYYATFQFESGDRLELSLSGGEYGALAEGDSGYLTFQGARYLGFERAQG